MEAADSFLSAWKKGDWKKMFESCQLTWASEKLPEDLKTQFSDETWKLKEYVLKGFTNVSNVKQVVIAELTFSDARVQTHNLIVICEDQPFKPAAFGIWGVNPVSVLRNFGTIKEAKKSTYESKNKKQV